MYETTFGGVPIRLLDADDVQIAILDGVVSEKLQTQISEFYNNNIYKDEPSLPDDDKKRGEYPMADGLLDYFPNALAEIARHSKLAGDKHHPGAPIHWARGVSADHRNKILRHLVDSGKKDKDGNRHTASLAWRALALLQEELEEEYGYPTPRNAID